MKLQLDHFFILVEPEAGVADLLVELGMIEGSRNIHQGQGTSNRRFYFSNGMLEFLWVHDAVEAENGPGKNLQLYKRSTDDSASPFGLILTRKNNGGLSKPIDLIVPFEGWQYQPDYFEPPYAFHIGENSKFLKEPLCIYVPFIQPGFTNSRDAEGVFSKLSEVNIYLPTAPSKVLKTVGSTGGLSLKSGATHLMEITFNHNQNACYKDFRPHIPLVVHW